MVFLRTPRRTSAESLIGESFSWDLILFLYLDGNISSKIGHLYHEICLAAGMPGQVFRCLDDRALICVPILNLVPALLHIAERNVEPGYSADFKRNPQL